MSDSKVSILFTGSSGLLYTDENGMEYKVHTERKGYTIVLSKKNIKATDSDRTLDDKESEIIISKIFNLMKGLDWRAE